MLRSCQYSQDTVKDTVKGAQEKRVNMTSLPLRCEAFGFTDPRLPTENVRNLLIVALVISVTAGGMWRSRILDLNQGAGCDLLLW